ncbi:unknown [Crocosphaera subtropica ATCC 51142]|uniref:GmrSD restriction endonucleases N-terminal domain-containing protein n=1 Tax=Crocosphaera subtropica (strain ATCC 51142 / BH68) TaxID=43989 RepID=B1WTJ4_CROS5|nr:DUF262 domain-containing protein [Crocosphaera subtropica]ACB53709.1 unknown [Crocosphaera subtropica ATCC 51142]
MSIKTLTSESITEQMQEEAEIEIREKKKVVDYNTIEYPIEVIVDKFLEGQDDDLNELFIPDYQREMIWDKKQQSKLIESILLGLPISYIYVADVPEDLMDDNSLNEDLARWEIIDGTQRIRTLARFLRDELVLQDLEKLKKLQGFKFSDLPLARQRRFKRTSIRIIQLTEDTDEETRRDLFERINTGSVELNAMEKRRGIRRGPFLNLIDELAKEQTFLNLCSFSQASIDCKDPQEYVLRFFAFLDNYHDEYKSFNPQKLTEFLDGYLEAMNNADNQIIENRKSEFYRMINFVQNYFPNGFYQQTKTTKKPVTRIKFESLSVGIALALRQKPNLKPQPQPLKLLDSKEFKEYTKGDGSSSKIKVIRRIEYVRDQLLGK